MNEKIPPQINANIEEPSAENTEPIIWDDVPKSAHMFMENEAPLHHDDVWNILRDDKIAGIQGG